VLVLAPAGGLRGTVVSADDHPVAGAAVTVEGAPWVARGATSDSAGAFRLEAVPREAVTLVVVARGYRTARVAFSRGEEGTDTVVRVKLASAEPVEGDVSDDDGRPVAAWVVACEGQPAEVHVESGDNGVFRLPPSAIDCDAVAEPNDGAPSDAAHVVEGRRLRLVVGAGGAIEGFVVDGRGSPVRLFHLGVESFVAARGNGSGPKGARRFEDVRGAFRWEKLPPGSYVLSASAPGKAPSRSDTVVVAGGGVARGVRVVLADGGVVAGHVYDERRAPVAGVAIHFDMVSSVVDSSAAATTGEDGAYRLEGAPAGPFTLRAEKGGYRMRMLSGLRVASGATLTLDVTLGAADNRGGMELGGIGASLMPAKGGIALAGVFPGDPAERAGLRAGDRVVRIDGEDTTSMSVADAIQRLRGEAGTTVGLSLQREGSSETIDVVVVRGTIVH
jgi:hypothetical protein